MALTVILFLVFFAMMALVLWSLWLRGETSGFAPKTQSEKMRLCWLVVGVVNFVAFLAHAAFDRGGFAFPTGGRLVDGVYHVTQHSKDFAFTPSRYLFSYWHGVLFVVIHLICMFALWRLKSRKTAGGFRRAAEK